MRAVTLRCRSWGCETCRPRRKAELIDLAKSGLPTKFITLTVNPARPGGSVARARELVEAWRVVVRRIKQKYGYERWQYLCVFERTKKGEAHLHILAKVGFIDQRWLSTQMRRLIDAPIVDIRAVKNAKQAAAYVSKYVGKEAAKFGTLKRYWSTRGYGTALEAVDDTPEPWEDAWGMDWKPLPQIVTLYTRLGWDIVTAERPNYFEAQAP